MSTIRGAQGYPALPSIPKVGHPTSGAGSQVSDGHHKQRHAKPGESQTAPEHWVWNVFRRLDEAVVEMKRDYPALDYHGAIRAVLQDHPDLVADYMKAMRYIGAPANYEAQQTLYEQLAPKLATLQTRELRKAFYREVGTTEPGPDPASGRVTR